MNVFNIFFRKKYVPLALNESKNLQNQESINNENKQEENKIDIKIFSNRIGEDIEYSIVMDSKNSSIPIGTAFISQEKNTFKEDISLKEMTSEIERVINNLSKAANGRELEEAKRMATEKLNRISNRKFKFAVSKEALAYVENYTLQSIDYKKLEQLPTKLDISSLSSAEIKSIGKQLTGRLNTLDSIETPDDAYREKDTLVSFMKNREELPENPIVEANIRCVESGLELDELTIIEIAKNMEKINSEDGALYSTYLKLEEKRILKQIVKNIHKYTDKYDKISDVRNVNSYLSHIYEQINEMKGGFSPEVLEFIINSMKSLDVEIYTKRYRQKDLLLSNFINQDDYKGIPDRDEIRRYLHTRINNLGQLYCKNNNGNKQNTLRNFIENTNLKDSDNTESKEFLFIISQIEKTYINSKYGLILEEYRDLEAKTTDDSKLSFKERISKGIEGNGAIEHTEHPKRLQNNDRNDSFRGKD